MNTGHPSPKNGHHSTRGGGTEIPSRDEPRPASHAPYIPSGTALRLVGAIALFAAAVTAGQALYVTATGEELCVGGGCAVVSGLARVSPALFNLFGAVVFCAMATLAFLAARLKSSFLCAALHAVLAAALGAEGVLLGYQWHVASAWCIYCLGILTVVVTLNVLYSRRGFLFGLAAFGATLTIFSLLSFIPVTKSLDDGTFAVRPGAGSAELVLIFSESCPHCERVVEALKGHEQCSVRFNPIAAMPTTMLPGLEKSGSYDPRINLAAAGILGIDTVPIVIAKEASGYRVVRGEGAILGYVKDACSARDKAPSIFEPAGGSWLAPADDGCGIVKDCD